MEGRVICTQRIERLHAIEMLPRIAVYPLAQLACIIAAHDFRVELFLGGIVQIPLQTQVPADMRGDCLADTAPARHSPASRSSAIPPLLAE